MWRITPRDTRGFTLIELVVIILLVAAMAALFYPKTNLTDTRAASAARKLEADLRYAQQLVNTTQVRSGVRLLLTADPLCTPNLGYAVFTGNVSTNTATDPFTGAGYFVCMTGNFAGVTLTPGGGLPSGIVRFDSLGLPYDGADAAPPAPLAATGTITVSGGTVVMTITIQPTTGQITMN